MYFVFLRNSVVQILFRSYTVRRISAPIIDAILFLPLYPLLLSLSIDTRIAISVIAQVCYRITFNLIWQAPIGKRVVGLQIHSVSALSKPMHWQLILREMPTLGTALVAALGETSVSVGAGFAVSGWYLVDHSFILLRPDRRAAHDLIAKTKVVEHGGGSG